MTTEDNSVIDREVLRCARELNRRLLETLQRMVAEYDAAVMAEARAGCAPRYPWHATEDDYRP